MKERPIILNGEMVRALLDGRKTQTRRIMKVQPDSTEFESRFIIDSTKRSEIGKWCWAEPDVFINPRRSELFSCPFGAVGDRLWVREAFRVHSRATDVATLVYKASERQSWTQQTHRVPVNKCSKPVSPEKWTPSIHMPRWASRITLEITGVRVERLQDLSHEDAESEGIHIEVWDQTVVARNYLAPDAFFQFWSKKMDDYVEMEELYRESYRTLWQSIYGEESWQANPWAWVIEFKRVEQ